MNHNSEDVRRETIAKKETLDRIEELIYLASSIERSNPKRSLDLAKEAYHLSQNINEEVSLARSLYRIGRSLWLLGDLDQAVLKLFSALEYIEKQKNDFYKVDVLNTLGNTYFELENYDMAMEYYMKALKLAKAIEYKKMEASILSNIGEIYKELEQYQEALGYYEQSIQMRDEMGDEAGKGIPLLNMGTVFRYLRDYKAAIVYSQESLKIFQGMEDKIGESHCLHQMGKIFMELNQNEEAFTHYAKSLGISEKMGDRFLRINLLMDLQECLMRKGDETKALGYLQEALHLAEEVKVRALTAKACSHLAHIFEEKKDYEKALYYYKKYHDTEKDASNHKLEQKLKSIKTQFEMEQAQHEKEIYQLKNIELRQKTEELEKRTEELLESYRNVTIISEIGQNITSTLNLDSVLDRVYERMNVLMDATTLGICLYDKETGIIDYRMFVEEGKRMEVAPIHVDDDSSMAAWCIRNHKEILLNDVEAEYSSYVKDLHKFYRFGKRTSSIIYCPLMVENEIIGVITVQSFNKNAYFSYHLDTVRALGSYGAIAIKNAHKSQALAEEIRERKEAQKELERLNHKLLELSRMDGLTGIFNRRCLDEFSQIEWTRAMREQENLSLIMIDIDHFKEYNDHYGHLQGDDCLIQIAKTLKSALKRSTDFIARYGGDEFIAVLPNTDGTGACLIAEQMRQRIEKLKILHEYSSIGKYVSVTIGVSTMIPREKEGVDILMDNADKALYKAKQKGRNRVEIYS